MKTGYIKQTFYTLALSALSFFAGCGGGPRKTVVRRKLPVTKERVDSMKELTDLAPTITIYIHGTFNVRFTKYFHGLPKHGLWRAKDVPNNYYVHYMFETLAEKAPKKFPIDSLYGFGWSGALSFEEREDAAQALYDAIKKELNARKSIFQKRPRVRIITVSHGGNVALNLAKVKPKNDHSFVVDELIMLCSPIQKATERYIKDPMFKKIYSLYSVTDAIQVADPQGIYKKMPGNEEDKRPFFSKRKFPEIQKALQARLTYNGRGLAHVEFIFPHMIRVLPAVLNELDHWLYELQNDPDRIMSKVEYILKIRT